MRKNILVLLFVCFGFMGAANAAMPSISACTVSSGVTAFPSSGGSMCSGEPDAYKLTVYEMKLCTSAITAPTTSVAAVTSSCQDILVNTSPSAMVITNGGSSAIAGTITRPPNGTYTHGYILISNALSVSDSRKFDTTITDEDGDTDGVYCATTATGINCSATDNLTAATQTMKLTSTHLTSFVSGDTEIVGYGTMNAWLLESDKVLGGGAANKATDDAAITYLVGQLGFTTPVVVSDATTSMSLSFDVSNGVMYANGNGAANPSVQQYVGPFMVRMSVE